MKKFRIEEDFLALFPDVEIGVVVCQNIDNHMVDREKYEALLVDAQKETGKYLTGEDFSGNPVIKVWREAFQKFKTKKGARASIEALLKRAQNGNPVGSINPLVDIYNAISLKYALPCGGENIDAFKGDLRLTLAEGTESFLPLGAEEDAPPYPGEVVYKDELGAVCRCWNWREAVRTMLTEETKNAFLCIESVDLARKEEFKAALEELMEQVKIHLDGNCRMAILDKDCREFELL